MYMQAIGPHRSSTLVRKNSRLGTSDLFPRACISLWAKFPTCLPTDVEERLFARYTPTPNAFDLSPKPSRVRIAEFHGTRPTRAITHVVCNRSMTSFLYCTLFQKVSEMWLLHLSTLALRSYHPQKFIAHEVYNGSITFFSKSQSSKKLETCGSCGSYTSRRRF